MDVVSGAVDLSAVLAASADLMGGWDLFPVDGGFWWEKHPMCNGKKGQHGYSFLG